MTAAVSSIATVYVTNYLKPDLWVEYGWAFIETHPDELQADGTPLFRNRHPKLGNFYPGQNEKAREESISEALRRAGVRKGEFASIEQQDFASFKILVGNTGWSPASDVRLGVLFMGRPRNANEGILRTSVTPNVQATIPERLAIVFQAGKPRDESRGDPAHVIILRQLAPRSRAIVSLEWTLFHDDMMAQLEGRSALLVPKVLFVSSSEVVGRIGDERPIATLVEEEAKITTQHSFAIINTLIKTKSGAYIHLSEERYTMWRWSN
jgi:hypothetical protein